MFSTQLNALCALSERRVTNTMLVRALADRGCGVSTPYLSQLRRGVRVEPAAQIVEALADYFGVPVEYFFAPLPTGDTDGAQADREALRKVDNAALRRLLACTEDLSAVSMNLLIEFADRLRVVETLPKFVADLHIYNHATPHLENIGPNFEPLQLAARNNPRILGERSTR